MLSCGGNDADTTNGQVSGTETDAVTESESPDVVEWTPPTYEEMVEKLMVEGKVIADFIRENHFVYGDAQINPAINWRTLDPETAIDTNERIVACDRMVSWILFRGGFIDQDYRHGIDLIKYFEEHDFQRIDSTRSLQAGDLVFVNPDANGNPLHVFMCAGPNKRYDGGSNERINGLKGSQPFSEPVNNFVYAYRPNPAKMPNPSMLKIYDVTADNVASVSQNSTVIYEQGKTEGTLAIDHLYAPGKEYSQYELHLSLTSTSDKSGSDEISEASFVGIRLPSKRKNARDAGGIFLSLNGTNKAGLYFGRDEARYNWYETPSVITLPENFSSAHKIAVVDAGDVIKCYMYLKNGEEYLICSIGLSAEYDQAVVRDHDGNIVYSGSAIVNDDGYFGVWSYKANTITTDIALKAS